MKIILLIILGLLPFITFSQKQNAVSYQLNGEVNFPKGDETGRIIYFVYEQNGTQRTDSIQIDDNKFSFNGTADINIKASLQFTRPNATPEPAFDPNTLSFYLNNGLTDVKAAGYLKRAQVVGSAMEVEYVAFLKKYSVWDRPLTVAGWRKRGLGKNDSLKLKVINARIDSIQNVKMNELTIFLNDGIAKPYAVEAILMYLRAKGSSMDMRKAETYFKQLPEEQKHAADGQQVEKMIADLNNHQSHY